MELADNGRLVYYTEDGLVHSGRIMEIEETDDGFDFQIDTYGNCEGQYVISSHQIGRTVFFEEEAARSSISL